MRKKQKPQKKSKNTSQVNRPVSFNLLDPDQAADYEFTLKWFNFSGRVKEWIRAQRLGLATPMLLQPDVTEEDFILPEIDEADALRSIV